jgi:putative tryptophan/tyrosine transport system substrate-binding protein
VIERREFLVGSVAALAAPVVGEAQEYKTEQIRRVGILSGNSARAAAANVDGLRRGLRDLGYVEGRGIAIEARYADGKFERLPGLADELVRLKLDVIVTSGIPGALALKKATSMIPIVVAAAGDLVGNGLVVSAAAPGTNVTGIDEVSPDTSGERLTLLREAVPLTSPVAILSSATPSTYASQWQGTERAAQQLGLTLKSFEVRDGAHFERAFAAMTHEKVTALIVFSGLLTTVYRVQLVNLAERHSLPAMYWSEGFVQAGGLMSYGPSVPRMFRQSATLVDRLLKGATPSDLPVQRPTKVDLAINLKTAKALGLTIPPSLLQRADQVIE